MPRAAQTGFIETLGPDARREVLARARKVRVRRGQVVMARGEQSGEVFFIQEGRLHVVLYGADGREVSLRDVRDGQSFGELSAIDGLTRSVSIVAVEDTRMLAVSGTLFRSIVSDNHEVANWLIKRLAAQVRNLTDRVFEMTALTVRARLLCELLRLARDQSHVYDRAPTHSELANRIGARREAVTLELRALAQQGVVRTGRQYLQFLDIDKLEDLVAENTASPLDAATAW
jgi:CRP-like cAMP-binding protein